MEFRRVYAMQRKEFAFVLAVCYHKKKYLF